MSFSRTHSWTRTMTLNDSKPRPVTHNQPPSPLASGGGLHVPHVFVESSASRRLNVVVIVVGGGV